VCFLHYTLSPRVAYIEKIKKTTKMPRCLLLLPCFSIFMHLIFGCRFFPKGQNKCGYLLNLERHLRARLSFRSTKTSHILVLGVSLLHSSLKSRILESQIRTYYVGLRLSSSMKSRCGRIHVCPSHAQKTPSNQIIEISTVVCCALLLL
jgi:hypothetical protein